jgi:aspartyl-tRNA(Asn)/glutamyl-tRNA(Gln) amidotransferase subunit B
VQHAIDHEIARQTRILDAGGHIVQETRLWDADAGVSQSMRGKEEANDYRYFPDPDLPPLAVEPALLEQIAGELPELPAARYRRLIDAGLADEDARTLVEERELAEYFDAAITAHGDPASARSIANWILAELLATLNRTGASIEQSPVSPAHLAELIGLMDDETLSGKLAKQVFASMVESGESPGSIVERQGLRQITDESQIEEIAARIVNANPTQAEAYRGGKTRLLGFFVGLVMKETRGKANPAAVNKVLEELLSKG